MVTTLFNMFLKKILFCCIIFFILSCKNTSTKNDTKKHKYTNSLIHETSPYLLQHAHNPVNWYPWNEKTLELAKKENKLLLISIGYSSCHWCHVMEKESFENEEVAKIMNDNFINVKIDREERPDIDKVYMTAVQLMTGSGGWPLNCIALPNGKPVFGGTYFPKDQWINVLNQISSLYTKEPQELINYAEKLTEGIKENSLISINNKEQDFNKSYIKNSLDNWFKHFDNSFGSIDSSPKFPMPVNYEFLLQYAYLTKNKELLSHVNTTLTKMALGGIFDQSEGGFSRYSTDKKWHIPHFEKMLYDNGQLVSLYSNAYTATQKPLYKETVYQTLNFIEKELMDKSGGFYSSLDADSSNEHNKLEEGAYYVWTKNELTSIIPKDDFDLFSNYFGINSYGLWEEEKYHLIRKFTNEEFSKKYDVSLNKLNKKVAQWRSLLTKHRSKKNKPRLDDKILTSWNALTLKGYVDAYKAFDDSHFLNIALKNANFIKENLIKQNGEVFRNYKNGKASINAYLEDYATLINAYLSLYQVTFDSQWLSLSKKLTDYVFNHFYDEKSNFFYYTSNLEKELIAKKIETDDNVIASSNSIMAKNLFLLSHFYENEEYLKVSKQMLHNISPEMNNFPSSHANWLSLYLNYTYPFYEVAISGNKALEKSTLLNKVYLPNKLVAGSLKESNLPLLKNRFSSKETYIYVCINKACKLPTSDVKKAINQLKN